MENQPAAEKRSKYLVLAGASITFNIVMLVFPFLLLDLGRALGLFAILIWASLNYILIGLTIASVIYFLLQFRTGTWKKSIPFMTNGVTVFILMVTPYPPAMMNIRQTIELQINKVKYEPIIEKVDRGELEPKGADGYVSVSSLDRDFILVNKTAAVTSVFFDIGIDTSVYSGFMYRSDDTPPPSSLMDDDWMDCKREERFWYYCTSMN